MKLFFFGGGGVSVGFIEMYVWKYEAGNNYSLKMNYTRYALEMRSKMIFIDDKIFVHSW